MRHSLPDTQQLIASPEIAPELTGQGLPLSKRDAYNRVYDQPHERIEIITSVQP